jgi:hypothetical protein
MSWKSSFLYSIFNNKCPRCHEGDFFIDRNAYHLRHMAGMYKQCQKCGQPFELEPWFYYGAMYVSYAVSVFFSFSTAAIVFFIFKVGLWTGVTLSCGMPFLIYPLIFRWSRLIWINVFVKYDPHAVLNKNQ